MILLFLITVAFIFWLDGLPLIKKGLRKEFYTLTCLICFAGLIGVLKLLNLSDPISLLNTLLRPLGEALFS